jgi:uncharacterized membrane protein
MQQETPQASGAMQHEPPPVQETERQSIAILPKNRVEALTDGIVAIATTLLVFEIEQPLVQGGLTDALLSQWPSYATYVVSFLTIAIIWVNHHDLMSLVARVDRTFPFLTTVMLMGLCAIPFPTGLLGHYLQAGHNQRPAAMAYALVMVFTVGVFPVMWLHLAANPHLLHDPAHTTLCGGRFFRRSLLGPGIYAASLALAVVSPQAAAGAYALVAVYYVLPPLPTRQTRGPLRRRSQAAASPMSQAQRPALPAYQESTHVRVNTGSSH